MCRGTGLSLESRRECRFWRSLQREDWLDMSALPNVVLAHPDEALERITTAASAVAGPSRV